MKKLLFFLITFLYSFNSFCQPFEKTYFLGNAVSMVQRPDSSFVLSIYQMNHGLLEIGQNGDSIVYTDFPYFHFQKIIRSKIGGFIAIGGYIHVGSSVDASIIRLDSSLDTIWVKEYPMIGFHSQGQEILELPDSSLLVGFTGNAGMSHVGFRLLHLDKDGNILWNNYISPESDAYIYNLACNDSFVYTALNERYDHLQLNCYDISTGDTIWEKKYYSYTSNSKVIRHRTNSMVLSDSALYIAGYDMVDSSGVILNQQTIFKTDLSGDSTWLRSDDHGQLTKIIGDSNNYFACLGANFSDSVSLSSFNIAGSLIWSKKFIEYDQCWAYELIPTLDDGFAFCGQAIDTTNGIYYTYAVRTDSTGNGFITSTFPIKIEVPIHYYYDPGLRQLTITCDNAEENSLEASIYSLNGTLLMEKSLSKDTNRIPLGESAPGTYIVVIRKNNIIVSRSKFIVN